MKYSMLEIYKGRIEEIDSQIRVCVKKKQWGKVQELRDERKGLMQRIKELEEKKIKRG